MGGRLFEGPVEGRDGRTRARAGSRVKSMDRTKYQEQGVCSEKMQSVIVSCYDNHEDSSS